MFCVRGQCERNGVGPGVATAEPADRPDRSLERNNMADEAAFQFLHNEVIQYIYKSAESGETVRVLLVIAMTRIDGGRLQYLVT